MYNINVNSPCKHYIQSEALTLVSPQVTIYNIKSLAETENTIYTENTNAVTMTTTRGGKSSWNYEAPCFSLDYPPWHSGKITSYNFIYSTTSLR